MTGFLNRSRRRLVERCRRIVRDGGRRHEERRWGSLHGCRSVPDGAHYRDGEATGFERVSEHVTPELACFVEVERYRAKVGGRDDITPVSVRVTSILRKEDGVWRLVHRHADPIISSRPAESVIQE